MTTWLVTEGSVLVDDIVDRAMSATPKPGRPAKGQRLHGLGLFSLKDAIWSIWCRSIDMAH